MAWMAARSGLREAAVGEFGGRGARDESGTMTAGACSKRIEVVAMGAERRLARLGDVALDARDRFADRGRHPRDRLP